MKKKISVLIGAVLLVVILCSLASLGAVAGGENVSVSSSAGGSISVKYTDAEGEKTYKLDGKGSNIAKANVGTSLTVMVAPGEGYKVKEFTVGGTKTSLTGNTTYTVDSVEEEKKYDFAVEFEQITYAVSVNNPANGTISVKDNATSVVYNGSVEISVEPAEGYKVKSFKINSVEKELTNKKYTATNVKAAISAEVEFEQITYTITLENTKISGPTTVTHGNNATYTITPDEDYVLNTLTVGETNVYELDEEASETNIGFVTFANGAYSYTLTNVTSDTTLNATFIKTYEVNVPVNSGDKNGTVSVSRNRPLGVPGVLGGKYVAVSGTTATVTITPKTGYVLDTLTVNTNPVDASKISFANGKYTYYLENIVSGKTVDVSYIKTYEISTSSDENGTVSVDRGTQKLGVPDPANGIYTVVSGTSASLELAPKKGYALKSLTVDNTEIKTGIAYSEETGKYTYQLGTISSNVVVSATFIKQHTITIDATDTNGTVSGDLKVLDGNSATYTITPKDGFVIYTLTVGTQPIDVSKLPFDNNAYTYTLSNVTADTTIKATFIALREITASAGENGTISVDRGTQRTGVPPIDEAKGLYPIESGTTSTVKIKPNTGYVLEKLTVDNVEVTSGISFENDEYTYSLGTVTKNKDVNATFIKKISVTTNIPKNGTVTVSYETQKLGVPAADTENGKYTVVENTAVSLVLTPSEGYVLSSLKVNGSTITEGLSYSTGNYTYSLGNVAEDKEIVVTYVKKLSVTAGTTGNGSIAVTFDKQPLGTPDSDGEHGNYTVVSGTTLNISITANTGYILNTLTVGTTEITSGITFTEGSFKYSAENVTADTAISATFIEVYKVVLSTDENGGIELMHSPQPLGVPAQYGNTYYFVKGSTVSVTVKPNTGYKVNTFTANGANAELTNSKYEITSIDKKYDISVTYTLKEYAIIGEVAPDEETHVTGTITPNSPILTHFSDAVYTITPGTGCEVKSLYIAGDTTDHVGDIVTDPSTGVMIYTVEDISGPVTATVTYKLKQYEVSTNVVANDDTRIGGVVTVKTNLETKTDTDDNAKVNHFYDVEFTMTPKEGCEVASLIVNGTPYTDQIADNKFTYKNVSGPVKAYVTYQLKSYAVDAEVTSGENTGTIAINPEVETAKHFDAISVTVTPATGYEIESFTINGIDSVNLLVENDGSFTYSHKKVEHELHFKVAYKLKEYDVTCAIGVFNDPNKSVAMNEKLAGEGTVEVEESIVKHFSDAVYTITPAEGCEVYSVIIDGETENRVNELVNDKFTVKNISGPVNVTVVFKMKEYSVIAAVSSNGTVDPIDAVVIHGDNLTINVEPRTGYEVTKFLIDGAVAYLDLGTTYTFKNVTENHKIVVEFAIKRYAITASSGSNGTITPKGNNILVNYGEDKAFTIKPNDGYEVDVFKVDGVETEVPENLVYTFETVTESHAIDVTFKKIPFTMKATAGEFGSISPVGEKTVNYGDTVTYTISPLDGYEIDTFLVDGQPASATDGKYTFTTIKADHTIDVTFKRITGAEYKLATEIISGHEYLIVSGGYALTNNNGKIGATKVFEALDGSYIIAPEGGSILWMISDTVGNRDARYKNIDQDEIGNYYTSTGKYTISNGDYLFVSGSSSLLDITGASITNNPTNDILLHYASYEWSYDFTQFSLTQKGLGTTLSAYYSTLLGFSTVAPKVSALTSDTRVKIYETGKAVAHVHIAVSEPEEEATCTAAGYTGGAYCGICHMEMEERHIIQPLGHDWDDGVIDVEPTETMYGTKIYTCNRCSKQKIENVPYVPPVVVNPFSDVKEKDFYYDAVLWAVDKGITSGTGGGMFSPDKACTRGEVVTFLWRANGCPEPESTINPFTDVKEKSFYYKAVLWAVEKGITSGTGGGKFSPSAVCTRSQVATFIWRSEGKPTPTTTVSKFSDIKSSAYYYTAVLWAVENGITSGTGGGKFSPDMNCSRGQIVTFLYRDIGKKE